MSTKTDLHNQETGKRLKECRSELGFTQERLAKEANFTKQFISALENGKSLTVATARRLAAVLHVRMEYLLCEDNYKTIDELQERQNTTSTYSHQLCFLFFETLGFSLSGTYERNNDRKICLDINGSREKIEFNKCDYDDFVDDIIEFAKWRYARFLKKGTKLSDPEWKEIPDSALLPFD